MIFVICIWISVLIISCLAADHVNNIITKELVIGIEIYLPFIRYTQIWKAAVVLVVGTMQSFSRKQQLWSTEIDVGKTGRQLPKVSITKSVKKWITTGSMCQIQKAVYEILFIKFDVTRHTRRKYSSLFINVQDWERRTRRKYSSLFINEQDWEREVDVEEYMASSSTVAWASHTLSCVEFVMWRSCLVLNHMYDKVKRASKEDLQPDVVEEKGVEDAAQLLSLVDVPQDESLAEVVAARLLQL